MWKGIHVTAYSPLGAGTLITSPIFVAMGKKHSTTAAQVLIRWHIQRGFVTKLNEQVFFKKKLTFKLLFQTNCIKIKVDLISVCKITVIP